MRLDLFSPGDNVLLLGEGNFTFAVDLKKHNLPILIFATCFESEIAYDLQQDNIDFLEDSEVEVYLDVDATKVHEHEHVKERKYSKIVFNFPHVGGKMKIHLNRELLKNTFLSVHHLLEPDGEIWITLCQGQGGTPADNPQRRWDDTWQISEMAAEADLILTAVEPFVHENFQNYKRVGYRGQDVEFNTNGALVHIFKKATPPYNGLSESTQLVDNLGVVSHENVLGSVEIPNLHLQLYELDVLKKRRSPVKYFYDILVSDLKKAKDDLVILSDDDVSLYTSDANGANWTFLNLKNNLRSCPTQIMKDVLVKWEGQNENCLILFPGFYFKQLKSCNFLLDSPVSYNLLIFGKNSATFSYRFLSKLLKTFNVSNVSCALRPMTNKFNEAVSAEDTVVNLYNADDMFKWKFVTEWAYLYLDGSRKDEVVCRIYHLEYKEYNLEACVISVEKLSSLFLNIESWKELWSRGGTIRKETIDGIEKPVLKQALLYPKEYTFDITLKTTKQELKEEEVYEVLWLAAGHLISDVMLDNKYISKKEGWTSYCYRITYKSLDEPLFRKRIVDIHTHIVGKMLSKALPVTIS